MVFRLQGLNITSQLPAHRGVSTQATIRQLEIVSWKPAASLFPSLRLRGWDSRVGWEASCCGPGGSCPAGAVLTPRNNRMRAAGLCLWQSRFLVLELGSFARIWMAKVNLWKFEVQSLLGVVCFILGVVQVLLLGWLPLGICKHQFGHC